MRRRVDRVISDWTRSVASRARFPRCPGATRANPRPARVSRPRYAPRPSDIAPPYPPLRGGIFFLQTRAGGVRTSATVASTSRVSEVVIVWRTMGWSEPILTLPMVTVLRVGIGRRRRGQHGNPARESRKGNNGSHRFGRSRREVESRRGPRRAAAMTRRDTHLVFLRMVWVLSTQ